MLSRSGSSDGEVEEQSCDVSIDFLYDEQLGDLTVGPRLGEQLGSPKDDGGHLYIHISDTPLTTLVPLFETLVQWPAQLARLVELRASHNQLTALPADLAQPLPCLATLDISHNSLSGLPDWIGVCCPQLRRLRIDSNAICSVPRSFSCLTRLKTFFYGQNPLPTVPKDVRLLGCVAALNYLIDSTAPSEADISRSSDSDEAPPFDSDLDSFDPLSPSFNSPALVDDSPLRERRPLPAARSRSPGVFLAQNRWRLSGTDTGPAPRQRNSWMAPEPSKPRHHSRQFLLNRSPLLSDSSDLDRSSTEAPASPSRSSSGGRVSVVSSKNAGRRNELSWSLEQTLEWLSAQSWLGAVLPHVLEQARAHQITADAILDLTPAMIQQQLGIVALSMRLRLLRDLSEIDNLPPNPNSVNSTLAPSGQLIVVASSPVPPSPDPASVVDPQQSTIAVSKSQSSSLPDSDQPLHPQLLRARELLLDGRQTHKHIAEILDLLGQAFQEIRDQASQQSSMASTMIGKSLHHLTQLISRLLEEINFKQPTVATREQLIANLDGLMLLVARLKDGPVRPSSLATILGSSGPVLGWDLQRTIHWFENQEWLGPQLPSVVAAIASRKIVGDLILKCSPESITKFLPISEQAAIQLLSELV
ncbi:MAG: hypothetical protein Q8P67_22685, partial [archaeon]|nr:hypothetical protein [archaeon]